MWRHHGFGWRIHCGVEVTESSTKKQHTLCVAPMVAWVGALKKWTWHRVCTLSARGMSSHAVQVLTSSEVGRGWFATRRLQAGERVFVEMPIVSKDLTELAQKVLDTPALREGLHAPAGFPMRANNPPTCPQQAWSKAMAQAGSIKVLQSHVGTVFVSSWF